MILKYKPAKAGFIVKNIYFLSIINVTIIIGGLFCMTPEGIKKLREGLYYSKLECPVCFEKIEVVKVKQKYIRVKSRDTDFCVYYEGINPLFYDVWICNNCGYASQSYKFEKVSLVEAKLIQKNVSMRWHKREMNTERDLEAAIQAFEIALLNAANRNAKNSEVARLCIRLAWLNRFKDDKEEEKKYLEFALKNFIMTYSNERFPVEKLDAPNCMYIIGELYRRLGNPIEASNWFSKVLSSPEAKLQPSIIEMARDQLQVAKEERCEKNKEIEAEMDT